jgi:2-polyprenyl-3-methyl-5-hydroxy-6-metoxy-1,4-benzoquinol methylase
MDLQQARKTASLLSGGTSSDDIKEMIQRCLRLERAAGSVIDFGAGKGELLGRLVESGRFSALAGTDLFPRPADLDSSVEWYQQDLNEPISFVRQFDCVICSETIEHLENPRNTFRCLDQILKPGGLLVLTMPNQESIRSYLGLIAGGHFAGFLGASYPAHITALLRLDLVRLCREVGFSPPEFHYNNSGGIPKFPHLSWQRASLGLLRGRLFSDNIAMVARKPAPPGAGRTDQDMATAEAATPAIDCS